MSFTHTDNQDDLNLYHAFTGGVCAYTVNSERENSKGFKPKLTFFLCVFPGELCSASSHTERGTGECGERSWQHKVQVMIVSFGGG